MDLHLPADYETKGETKISVGWGSWGHLIERALVGAPEVTAVKAGLDALRRFGTLERQRTVQALKCRAGPCIPYCAAGLSSWQPATSLQCQRSQQGGAGMLDAAGKPLLTSIIMPP